MKRLCVIGDPVLHSASPAIHTALLGMLGEDAEYLCKPVTAAELPAFLADMRRGDWAGCNVTMPHKSAVIPHLDRVEEGAAHCGAVNTICNKNGELYGYSTDGAGFCRMLTQAGIDPAGKTVLLLGAGGAARSVAWALEKAGVKRLLCANRTAEKAEELCNLIPGRGEPLPFEGETLCRGAEACEILINATSLGMTGTQGQFADLRFVDALPAGAAVFDLIYRPARTELLRRAEERGLLARNGLDMLLHQAVLSLELFLDRPLDPAAALAAARAGLERAN